MHTAPQMKRKGGKTTFSTQTRKLLVSNKTYIGLLVLLKCQLDRHILFNATFVQQIICARNRGVFSGAQYSLVHQPNNNNRV